MNFNEFKTQLILGSGVIIVGWATWVTHICLDSASQSDVIRVIQTSAPYVEDRKFIMQSLSRVANVIEENTRAINELRIQMAKEKKN